MELLVTTAHAALHARSSRVSHGNSFSPCFHMGCEQFDFREKQPPFLQEISSWVTVLALLLPQPRASLISRAPAPACRLALAQEFAGSPESFHLLKSRREREGKKGRRFNL